MFKDISKDNRATINDIVLVSIVNFEHISFVQVFLLLNLNS